MNGLALTVGYAVLSAAGAIAAFIVAVLMLAFWPIAWTWMTHGQKQRQGRFTPRIDWRNNVGQFNTMNALIGLSSRGKSRWFFGLILFDKSEFERELAMPKLIVRKATTAAKTVAVGTQRSGVDQ